MVLKQREKIIWYATKMKNLFVFNKCKSHKNLQVTDGVKIIINKGQ